MQLGSILTQSIIAPGMACTIAKHMKQAIEHLKSEQPCRSCAEGTFTSWRYMDLISSASLRQEAGVHAGHCDYHEYCRHWLRHYHCQCFKGAPTCVMMHQWSQVTYMSAEPFHHRHLAWCHQQLQLSSCGPLTYQSSFSLCISIIGFTLLMSRGGN